MSAALEKCDSEILEIVARMISANHPPLAKARVRIDCLFAFEEEGEGPAVMLHGYPCAAVVRKVSYKNRVMGRGDAEIVIDREWWESATARQRDALIDHELTHLEIPLDKYGEIKRDRAGRPRLHMRLHDWQLGGFEVIARRWAKDAAEVAMANDFMDRFGQFVFGFAAEPLGKVK